MLYLSLCLLTIEHVCAYPKITDRLATRLATILAKRPVMTMSRTQKASSTRQTPATK